MSPARYPLWAQERRYRRHHPGLLAQDHHPRGAGPRDLRRVASDPANIFGDPEYAGAPILIAGDNFGCGSSREHAAWALLEIGLKFVIAPSFSVIFSGNDFKIGILTVALPQEAIDRPIEVAQTDPIDIHLEAQTVTMPFQDRFSFDIDAFRERCVLGGSTKSV